MTTHKSERSTRRPRLTYRKLMRAINGSVFPELINNYENVLDYWNAVETEFPRWKEDIALSLDVTEDELDAFINVCPECREYVNAAEFLIYEFNSRYYDYAYEHYHDAYDYPDTDYVCKVCGRPIEYSSEDSVMLNEDKWKTVLDHYHLTDYEKEAARRKSEFYTMCERRGGLRLNPPADCNTFICNDCMEKALGHPLTNDDINDSVFNEEYRELHHIDEQRLILSDADKREIYEDVMHVLSDIILEQFEEYSDEQIFDAAKQKFGVTYDLREAGYVLPDGTMLDFSGRHEMSPDADTSDLRGRRTADHRDIDKIKYDRNDQLTGYETDMSDFIRRGAIRIAYENGCINLDRKPTREQREVLRRLIARKDGYVYIDFGHDDTEWYVEYDGARPQKVLAAIDRYYDEGIRP